MQIDAAPHVFAERFESRAECFDAVPIAQKRLLFGATLCVLFLACVESLVASFGFGFGVFEPVSAIVHGLFCGADRIFGTDERILLLTNALKFLRQFVNGCLGLLEAQPASGGAGFAELLVALTLLVMRLVVGSFGLLTFVLCSFNVCLL